MDTEETALHAQMMQHILAKWISKPIGLVAKLGIPDLLSNGSMSISELANATQTDVDSLYRVLRALASVGIFHEQCEQQFALTPLGKQLTTDALRYQAILFSSKWHDRAWAELEYSVTTGKSAFEQAFGKPAFEWLAENDDDARVHSKAMAANLESRTQAVIKAYDFSKHSIIVDVGSGNGSLLAAIASQCHSVCGIAADLKGVVGEAEKTFTQRGISERLKTQPCNFMKNVPKDGDLYILSNVLHDWNDADCQVILKNCRNAMSESSKILVIEFILPANNEFSPGKLLDLEMLIMSGGGRERSEMEYRDLLKEVGMKIENIYPLATGESLIELVCV